MGHSISGTIAVLNQARARKTLYCTVRKTKYMLKFLQVLRQHNYIYGFTADPETDKIYVYFRFHKHRPTLNGLKQISKPGHRRYVTFNRFNRLSHQMTVGQIYVTNSSFADGLSSAHGYELFYNRINRKQKCGELLATVW